MGTALIPLAQDSVFSQPSYDFWLPPEIWSIIFHYASNLERFFDSRWTQHEGILTEFDVGDHGFQHSSDAFLTSRATALALSLVCRQWGDLSAEFLYRHVVIRRVEQLYSLVSILEQSRDSAKGTGLGDNYGLGWWMTHFKVCIAEDRTLPARRLQSEDSSLSPQSNVASYVRRLLCCCPRIEVYIDAAPYGFDERSKALLSLFNDPTSRANIQSLEWVYGGPALDDLSKNDKVTSSIRSIRCNAIHTRLLGSTAPMRPLSFNNLICLDIYLSNAHGHWNHLAKASLPSLSILRIRSPSSIGAFPGAAPMRSFRAFLDAHGSKILTLDVDVSPGDEPCLPQLGDSEDEALSIPSILPLCPNLIDLIVSSRWLGPHDDAAPSSGVQMPTWSHPNVRRIGLRQTAQFVEGFSHYHAQAVCPSCNSTPTAVGCVSEVHDAWVEPPMKLTNRLCTINRLLHCLHGLSVAGGHCFDSVSRQIAPRRPFPSLTTIHLLDSESSMFGLDDARTECASWKTCWCTDSMRKEVDFWGLWGSRFKRAGMNLIGREGDLVPITTESKLASLNDMGTCEGPSSIHHPIELLHEASSTGREALSSSLIQSSSAYLTSLRLALHDWGIY